MTPLLQFILPFLSFRRVLIVGASLSVLGGFLWIRSVEQGRCRVELERIRAEAAAELAALKEAYARQQLAAVQAVEQQRKRAEQTLRKRLGDAEKRIAGLRRELDDAQRRSVASTVSGSGTGSESGGSRCELGMRIVREDVERRRRS